MPVSPAQRTCSCGRVCASRSGLSTHAVSCRVEQARSRAFVAAVEAGLTDAELVRSCDAAVRWALVEQAEPVGSPRARLADVRVLPERQRSYGDPSTWAWDTYSETIGLYCLEHGELSESDAGATTSDNDSCSPWGHEAGTRRVVVSTSGELLRGPAEVLS